jgi:hypothetical protein
MKSFHFGGFLFFMIKFVKLKQASWDFLIFLVKVIRVNLKKF